MASICCRRHGGIMWENSTCVQQHLLLLPVLLLLFLLTNLGTHAYHGFAQYGKDQTRVSTRGAGVLKLHSSCATIIPQTVYVQSVQFDMHLNNQSTVGIRLLWQQSDSSRSGCCCSTEPLGRNPVAAERVRQQPGGKRHTP